VIVVFHEKHDDERVEGDSLHEILYRVMKQRLDDGYWYEDETPLAEAALEAANKGDFGPVLRFMKNRQTAEYESWEEI
jgi:hypothetical protein